MRRCENKICGGLLKKWDFLLGTYWNEKCGSRPPKIIIKKVDSLIRFPPEACLLMRGISRCTRDEMWFVGCYQFILVDLLLDLPFFAPSRWNRWIAIWNLFQFSCDLFSFVFSRRQLHNENRLISHLSACRRGSNDDKNKEKISWSRFAELVISSMVELRCLWNP